MTTEHQATRSTRDAGILGGFGQAGAGTNLLVPPGGQYRARVVQATTCVGRHTPGVRLIELQFGLLDDLQWTHVRVGCLFTIDPYHPFGVWRLVKTIQAIVPGLWDTIPAMAERGAQWPDIVAKLRGRVCQVVIDSRDTASSEADSETDDAASGRADFWVNVSAVLADNGR